MDYVEQGEIKQLLVQRKDGSTWTAEIGLDGRVHLLKQLSDPDAGAEQLPDQLEDGEQITPAAPSPQPVEQQAEEAEQQPGSWGEEQPEEQSEGYSDKELEQLIDKMSDRDTRMAQGKRRDGQQIKPIPKKVQEKLKDNAFKARLASVMLDNKYDRRVRGRTRGKLDMTKLYKVPTQARSLFMQKQARKGKQYNVVLLVDESGSMSGRPARTAAECALFLIKQFEGINVNVGIVGFNENVHVHKEIRSPADYGRIYDAIVNADGGTNDYEGMRRAYHMLRTAPDGEKILIMLSDGGPGGYRTSTFYGEDGKEEDVRRHIPVLNKDGVRVNYNDRTHLHHLVKANKDVASIGIGIGAGGWQIPDHFVIHNVDELKPTLIGVLRKHISRG